MMQIYYVNHNNMMIDFMGGNYNVEESGFFSHSWDYDTKEQTYGAIIERFKKAILEESLYIHIENFGEVACEKAYETFHNAIEADVLEKKHGRLYVNDYYVDCYLTESSPKYFVPGIGSISCELKVVAEHAFWIRETTKAFGTVESAEPLNNKRYPFKYPIRYGGNDLKNAFVINEHFTDANFKMVINGPIINPQVIIGNTRYLVNIELTDGELLEIDTRSRTIVKIMSNGAKESAYHNREKGRTFFVKIPPGRQSVLWNGNFAFDLIIYEERSEPKWSVQP